MTTLFIVHRNEHGGGGVSAHASLDDAITNAVERIRFGFVPNNYTRSGYYIDRIDDYRVTFIGTVISFKDTNEYQVVTRVGVTTYDLDTRNIVPTRG